MATENSITQSLSSVLEKSLFNGRPISVQLKPGEACPDGYVLVPMCPEPINCDGTPYTPALHSFFFGRETEQNIIALEKQTDGKYGKSASFILANGKTVQLAFTKSHHIGDPCLAKLSARDTKKLRKHLAA